MDYDASKEQDKIAARLLAINSADDQINPAELGVVDPAIKPIPGARFVLLPASDKTNGPFHLFHGLALETIPRRIHERASATEVLPRPGCERRRRIVLIEVF